METLQINKRVTGSQPQVGNVKIYTGAPIAPYAMGAPHTRQPPITGYKIYSSKQLPVVLVRLIGAGAEPFTCDFNRSTQHSIL